MHLFMITDQADIARFACERGVDWIMVDLEILGKVDRQGHLDTVMNTHNVEDVRRVRSAVPPGRLLVRTNPLNANSAAELDNVIGAGADSVMLPWFHRASEAEEYSRIVDGRAQIVLLAETRGAMDSLRECCTIDGVTRVHIGLNDLSLELNRRFMFELLIDGTVDAMAAELRALKMPFGIGGIARVGEGLLPAERILMEHARLGSDAAILSRTFHRQAGTVDAIQSGFDFGNEILELRKVFAAAQNVAADVQARNFDAIVAAVKEISARLPDRNMQSR